MTKYAFKDEIPLVAGVPITGFAEGGCMCPECFDKLASDRGILIRWLATNDAAQAAREDPCQE